LFASFEATAGVEVRKENLLTGYTVHIRYSGMVVDD